MGQKQAKQHTINTPYIRLNAPAFTQRDVPDDPKQSTSSLHLTNQQTGMSLLTVALRLPIKISKHFNNCRGMSVTEDDRGSGGKSFTLLFGVGGVSD